MSDLSPPVGAAGNGGSGSADNATAGAETLSPLEQEVLDEYARLLGNLNDLSSILSTLAENPSAEILDALRGLERKTSLVYTLLKASVYSIVLQQQIFGEGEEGSEGQQGRGDGAAAGQGHGGGADDED
ncbi:DASH complex subunit Dad3-domain-containing protein [Phyllosticta citribraziliensis]|uniref:DASH complex subunit DAD3 n=1 Tax=Phyllosticta citribraziliensis TaxID=989973 RepID=A0ABR1LM52_9PEZI